MPNTADYLNALVAQRDALIAFLRTQGVDVAVDEPFNSLVEKASRLHNTDLTYNPNSLNAQSGIATAEGIDLSVGDINAALAQLTEPGDIDPETWMNETVNKAIENIKAENAKTVSDEVKSALETLSADNDKTIKQQVGDAVDNLNASIRRAFLMSAKRVNDGNITFESNTIYAIVRVPAGNALTVYKPDTKAAVTLSDRHYCIIVGNEGDDIAGAVCATVLSYPSLDPQLYLISDGTHNASMNWSGTAIVSQVKNGLLEA